MLLEEEVMANDEILSKVMGECKEEIIKINEDYTIELIDLNQDEDLETVKRFPRSITELLKDKLTEDEIERLSVEVAKLEKLSPSDLQEVIDDFYGLCTTQKIISEGGVLYAEAAMTDFSHMASGLLDEVECREIAKTLQLYLDFVSQRKL